VHVRGGPRQGAYERACSAWATIWGFVGDDLEKLALFAVPLSACPAVPAHMMVQPRSCPVQRETGAAEDGRDRQGREDRARG
jgi:hypothetical protein